jgi:hypothetical protein
MSDTVRQNKERTQDLEVKAGNKFPSLASVFVVPFLPPSLFCKAHQVNKKNIGNMKQFSKLLGKPAIWIHQ